MINRIKLFFVTVGIPLYLSMMAEASYTLNGQNLEDFFKTEPRIQTSLKSKGEFDTAVIWFDQKDIKFKWIKNIDPDAVADEKIKEKGGISCEPNIALRREIFKDYEGLWGCFDNKELRIISNQFSFKRTSFLFEEKASIKADKSCPSIIRSLEFIKNPYKKSILLHGEVDFTKKDRNFIGFENVTGSGSGKIPGLLISGISELNIIFDKRKF